MLISCTGRDVYDILLFQKYLKDIKFRQLEPGLERLRCKSAATPGLSGMDRTGKKMPLFFIFNSINLECMKKMQACTYTYLYRYINQHRVYISLQLDGYRPLPESETSKSFLHVDERLFHLEQKHCQKGKHALGHVS